MKKSLTVFACAAVFSGVGAGSAFALPVGSTDIPVNLGSAQVLSGSGNGVFTGSADALAGVLAGSSTPFLSGSAQDLGNLLYCLFPSRSTVCVGNG